MSKAKPTCRLCGLDVTQVRGWLTRVNEKGVPGIYECRPRCEGPLQNRAQKVMGAIWDTIISDMEEGK